MKRVIIIGAGPAGLTAAHELLTQSKEYEVILLEESDQMGGISRTVVYKDNRMDIGGHRFFSKDERIMEWWKTRMHLQGAPAYDDKILGHTKEWAPNGPNPENEEKVMLLRRRVSRIYYKKKFFDYPISMKLKTFLNMGFIQTIKAGCSYLYSCLHKLEESSLENFYINRFGRVLYTMFFEGYTEKLWGRHPKEISADWGAQRVKGLSIVAIIKDMFLKLGAHGNEKNVETSLIEEFYYPKYGPGQLWEVVAQEIEDMGGKIIRNARVCKVILEEKKINKIVYVENGKTEIEILGDKFISTMPIKDLVASMDEVPDTIKEISDGLPYRDFVAMGLLLEKINLKNETKLKTLNNIIPDCWIYIQDVGVKLGRIQIFNNWSPYLVKNIDSKIWIGLEYFCKENDDFWNLSEEECLAFVSKELIDMGIIMDSSVIEDYHRERVKKAYPAYFDTYDEIDVLVKYLNEYSNLFCIGRNGQHRYNNMDHSMATAFEAVKNILLGKEDKQNVWNVNTEKEYHEET